MVLSLLLHPKKFVNTLRLMREASKRGVEMEDLPDEVLAPLLLKKFDATRWGLVPNDQVTRKPPADPELDRAVAEANEGRWEAGAELLASTRGDWARRDEVMRALARCVEVNQAFLRRWQEKDGSNPDLASLRSIALVHLAWQARGSRRAAQTSDEQAAGFHRFLAQADEAVDVAAGLLPDDPTPWMARVMVARGLGYDHDQFREAWGELVARDPHHRGGHVQALQYWCAKWHGSDELMMAFAEEAMRSHPSLAVLPMLATEELPDREDGDDDAPWQTPVVREALEVLLPRLAAEGNAPRAVRTDRGYAIFALTANGRHAEAVEQFRILGAQADADPWASRSNGLLAFLQQRADACRRAGKP
ncbi:MULTISPECIES: DUF4034 domain-containing protein [Actinosynnema]|uniref:DUF4034 domain-containing protein n=1 Tax=Actinosynnema TaxID=40566 RepID=UPI0020A44BBE|nr:DUF4034 domain-containing protein [Actinosynnema pretiosum]MCP2095618.1 hypothetical protein [Actinosynnema pretiosum]